METSYQEKDKLLIFEITEEIDHHTTEKIRRKMDHEITRYMPRKIMFNFNQVTFMDSAGIGMLIGRYKVMKALSGSIRLSHMNGQIRRILSLSGIQRYIQLDGEEAV